MKRAEIIVTVLINLFVFLPAPQPSTQQAVYFNATQVRDTDVYARDSLQAGQCISAPAIVEQLDAKILGVSELRC